MLVERARARARAKPGPEPLALAAASDPAADAAADSAADASADASFHSNDRLSYAYRSGVRDVEGETRECGCRHCYRVLTY